MDMEMLQRPDEFAALCDCLFRFGLDSDVKSCSADYGRHFLSRSVCWGVKGVFLLLKSQYLMDWSFAYSCGLINSKNIEELVFLQIHYGKGICIHDAAKFQASAISQHSAHLYLRLPKIQ